MIFWSAGRGNSKWQRCCCQDNCHHCQAILMELERGHPPYKPILVFMDLLGCRGTSSWILEVLGLLLYKLNDPLIPTPLWQCFTWNFMWQPLKFVLAALLVCCEFSIQRAGKTGLSLVQNTRAFLTTLTWK